MSSSLLISHSLPSLAYSYDALEPYIDAQTMEIHHSRHHQAYINNYLDILEGTNLLEEYSPLEILQNLQEVPVQKLQGVINNVGGHVNHSFFWTILSPNGGGKPTGKLAELIDTSFGGYELFVAEFNKSALTRFGSGWAWLVRDVDGTLVVTSTPNQDSPYSDGQTPIIGIDVWEHAYYLKYQNKRADYINAFWNLVDWEQAQEYCCGGK